MSQRYNDNTITPKPKENQLDILKNYAVFQKIQQRREHWWSYVSIYDNSHEELLYLPPKSCCNFT